MMRKKEDSETQKTDLAAESGEFPAKNEAESKVAPDVMGEVLAEVEEHKDAIVTGNIRVLLCVGNSNDPTYREVAMDRMAREIKARFQ